MKICYLILSHKNSKQICRMVHAIKESSPNSLIIVSHDVVNCPWDAAEIQNLPGVYVLFVKGGRGDFATVQNYLEAVDWLLSNNISFDWLMNLSGQCYPIQPLSKLEKFLSETSYDGFIEHFQVLSEQSPWGIKRGYSRYFYKYRRLWNGIPEWQQDLLKPLKLINLIQPFFRINFCYGVTLGVKTQTPFNNEFICYGGAFFQILSRQCIQYLHDFAKENRDVLNHYRTVEATDESCIQTIILNNKSFNICNDCKVYYDFSGVGNGHPRILSTKDYEMLIHSGKYFARKFDINADNEILDLFDARVLPSYQEECVK